MTPPRVLLLEDDASIRRFVAMALEELPIELVECETVALAITALREAPVRLVITDLMLHNESGFDLLQAIEKVPSLLPDGRVAVFSAGLGTGVMQQLAGHRIWRLLSKPTTVATLEACVREAISAPVPNSHGPADALPQAPERPALAVEEGQAVKLHFGGDAHLFTSYRATCMSQFPHDLASAATAFAQHDAAGLRRIGHSLKTVLKILGRNEMALKAQALDEAAAGIDWRTTQAAWDGLRSDLTALIAQG